uniref:NADH-cytochrome b5 reductase n=1 Tax=Rhizophora mucronata TaxID=61149 RepID=A0A2P2KFA5_RHIMU
MAELTPFNEFEFLEVFRVQATFLLGFGGGDVEIVSSGSTDGDESHGDAYHLRSVRL